MTGSIRLFVQHRLHHAAEFAVSAGQAHYLGSVMRSRVGDTVAVFNGTDGEWRAELVALRKDRATLRLVTQTRSQEAEPDLVLVFAPVKRDATDLIVEKATELGASRIAPVFTERTNTGRLNLERLGGIATEAAEQCERLTVPVIDAPVRLFDLLSAWPRPRVLNAAIERSGAGPPRQMTGPRALLVGPEGGFTVAELDALARSTFVEPIGLGPRILRAETAVIVGLALLQV